LQPIDASLDERARTRPAPPARQRPAGAPPPVGAPSRFLERIRRPLPPAPAPPQESPDAGRRGLRRWLRRWVRRHLPGLALGGLLLGVTAAALATGLHSFPPLTDDEGTYVAQAWAVRHGMLAHYTYWYDHPPLGWVQLSALQVFLSPINALIGGAEHVVLEARRAMLVPALASVTLTYLLARRLGLRRGFAAIAMAAFALNPLSVSLLRAVLLDGLALPWMLAAFVLALSPQRKLWSFAAAGACAAFAVLSKETMLIVVPALVLTVWQQSDRRTRSFCLTAFALPLVLLMLGYPLLAVLKGELLPGAGHVSLYEAIRFQLFDRPSTGSLLEAHSGSRAILDGWLGLDGVLLAIGLLAVPYTLRRRALRPIGLAIVLLTVLALRPGYLPQGYVLALLPLCAIAAAAALDQLWTIARPQLGVPTYRGVLTWAAVAVAIIGLIVVGGRWDAERGANDAFDDNRNYVAAVQYVEQHVDFQDRVLVDDTFFVDLADAGFEPGLGVVWFYKLDTSTNLDPSVRRALPRGAEEFDVVISTPIMRSALAKNPGQLREVRRALRNSEVVAVFGGVDAGNRVEIRRLTEAQA
jgi:hypothetical protein